MRFFGIAIFIFATWALSCAGASTNRTLEFIKGPFSLNRNVPIYDIFTLSEVATETFQTLSDSSMNLSGRCCCPGSCTLKMNSCGAKGYNFMGIQNDCFLEGVAESCVQFDKVLLRNYTVHHVKEIDYYFSSSTDFVSKKNQRGSDFAGGTVVDYTDSNMDYSSKLIVCNSTSQCFLVPKDRIDDEGLGLSTYPGWSTYNHSSIVISSAMISSCNSDRFNVTYANALIEDVLKQVGVPVFLKDNKYSKTEASGKFKFTDERGTVIDYPNDHKQALLKTSSGRHLFTFKGPIVCFDPDCLIYDSTEILINNKTFIINEDSVLKQLIVTNSSSFIVPTIPTMVTISRVIEVFLSDAPSVVVQITPLTCTLQGQTYSIKADKSASCILLNSDFSQSSLMVSTTSIVVATPPGTHRLICGGAYYNFDCTAPVTPTPIVLTTIGETKSTDSATNHTVLFFIVIVFLGAFSLTAGIYFAFKLHAGVKHVSRFIKSQYGDIVEGLKVSKQKGKGKQSCWSSFCNCITCWKNKDDTNLEDQLSPLIEQDGQLRANGSGSKEDSAGLDNEPRIRLGPATAEVIKT